MNNSLRIACLLGCLALPAAAQPMYGIMFRTGGQTSGLNPTLYNVDPVTGAATLPRAVNVNNCVGITIDPTTGIMYGLTDQFGRINNISGQGGKGLIFTINPATGAATAVGRTDPSGVFQIFEGDIAFNPVDGSFWGVSTLINTARLFRINKSTGLATLASSISPLQGVDLDISALAFSPSGSMYVLDTRYPNNPGPALIEKIDPATGAIIDSWNTGVLLGNVAGMTFGPDGVLYIADGDTRGTNRLYRFDFGSGQMTNIGATGAAGGIYQGLAGLIYPCGAASVQTQPASTTLCGDATVQCSITASGNGLGYQWQYQSASGTWTNFVSGSMPYASGTIGVSTPTAAQMTLALNLGGGSSPALLVRCIASNACSSATSDAGTLTIDSCGPSCPADFNNDGGIDGADVEAFFAAWESGDSSGDVNLDGGVDGSDIGTFFAVWEAGGC